MVVLVVGGGGWFVVSGDGLWWVLGVGGWWWVVVVGGVGLKSISCHTHFLS